MLDAASRLWRLAIRLRVGFANLRCFALASLDLTTPEIERLVAAFVTMRITKPPGATSLHFAGAKPSLAALSCAACWKMKLACRGTPTTSRTIATGDL